MCESASGTKLLMQKITGKYLYEKNLVKVFETNLFYVTFVKENLAAIWYITKSIITHT